MNASIQVRSPVNGAGDFSEFSSMIISRLLILSIVHSRFVGKRFFSFQGFGCLSRFRVFLWVSSFEFQGVGTLTESSVCLVAYSFVMASNIQRIIQRI